MAAANPMDDRSVLAAELALGLLDGDALATARALQRDDAEFAAEVDRWADHFAQLFRRWPEVIPPASLESRLMASAGLGANDNAARPWKWATGIASAAAAAFAVVAFTPRAAPPTLTPAPQVADSKMMTVAFQFDQAAMPAVVDMDRGQLRVAKGFDVPADKVAQLWLIEGETPPVPLGLFTPTPNGMAAAIKIERDLAAGAILAISIEPPGGSPTGLPTGPVVATGEVNPV